MPYKQPNGTYRASKMINGKRRQRVFRTKAEAVKWEAAQDAEAWDREERPTHTALSWGTAYLKHAEARFSHKTFLEKQLAFRNLFRFVDPSTPAASIPAKGIHEALTHRAVSSGNAANKDRKNLGAAWAWGRKVLGLPRENPFLDVERFAHDPRVRHMPTEEDFWKAHAAAGEEDQVFLLAALHTAARRGELFRLTWPDVDLAQRKIRLGTKKTKDGGMEYAWLPMTPQLHRAMEEHARGKRSMFVFCQEDGQPFTSRQHYMERLCRRAKVKAFGFHGIRHLTASILAKAGVDIPTIQAILRHKSPNTTARYIRSLGFVDTTLAEVFGGQEKSPRSGTSEG
ncbi:MAG: tyrosine-type recombinase/integrase [Thermodesulfobacteriota bacterium]